MKKHYLVFIAAFLFSVFFSVNLFAQSNFSPSQTQGCSPLTVTFTITPSGNGYRYEWNFWDNSPLLIDTLPNHVVHTYTAIGNFNPAVEIFDINGIHLGTAYCNNSIQVNGLSSISSPDSVCANDQVQFCTNGNIPVNSFNWQFSEGGSSTDGCPMHSYTSTGNYSVTVIANASGCPTYTLTKAVAVTNSVVPHPNAWTNLSGSPVCKNFPVSFYSNPSPSYSWNFGDGSPVSTLQNPVHSYTANNTYTVVLTVTNNCGKSGSTNMTVTVQNNAGFPNNLGVYSNNNNLCPGQQTNLYIPGGDGYVKYLWNFGDNSPNDSTSGTNVNHTYTAAATYTFSCKITNQCGQVNTYTNTVTVLSHVPFPNQPGFSMTNTSPACPGSNINLNAPGGYNNYQWDFGDGSPVTTTNNSWNNHTYSTTTPHTYTATVIVKNQCGDDSILHSLVQITNNAPWGNNNFQMYYQSTSCPNSWIGFQVPCGYNNYQWDFGDGSPVNSTTGCNNNHFYGSTLANYTVSVTITNGCGKDTVLKGVVQISNNVHFPNQTWFSLSGGPDPACPGDNISFNAPNSGYKSYQWDFGDGSPAVTNNNSNFQHVFSATNTYTVSVRITNNCNLDTTLKFVQHIVNNAAFQNVNFNINPNTACPNQSVSLNATSGFARYVWNFGDGSVKDTTFNEYVNHTYTAAATYTASVTIRNHCSKDTTINQTIVVSNNNQVPNNMGLSINSSPACPGSSVSFDVQSGFPFYTWNFGDGMIDSTSNSYYAQHTYTAAATYSVSVKVKNYCGNSSMVYGTVVINNGVKFQNSNLQLNLNPNPVCPGGGVYLNVQNNNGGNASYVSYVWNYGDGSPKDSVTYSGVNHTYTASNTYTASVKIRNYCGYDTTISGIVQVKPNVGFTSQLYLNYPTSSCPNDAVGFNVSSGYASYVWNFGDGHTASGSYYANHTYTATGTYNFSVTITNQCGVDTTLTNTEVIDNNGSFPNWMSVNVSPSIACPGSSIQFQMNPQGFRSYFWSFGDGDTATTSAERVQHTYTATGVYTMSCKVTNGCGKSQTIYNTVQISNNAPVSPVSIFAPSNPACVNDLLVFMVNGGGSTFTYAWDFGDGAKDTTIGGSPSHSYSATGTYVVKLTATNGCGNSSTTTYNVNITNNAYPVLVTPNGGKDGGRLWGVPSNGGGGSAGCANDVITFYFFGNYPNNLWDFGDGYTGVATQQMLILGGDGGTYPVTIIKHAYSANGTKKVKLTLTNHCNRSTTDSTTITIGGNLLVNGSLNISPPPYTTCTPVN
ncbi:MAG TPA: PKD domain-containing protein, partial [Bacteroidia bacterium]